MKTTSLLTLALTMAQPAWALEDSDGNGLSDVFELIYFGGLAGLHEDPDGDGVDNYNEMVWGTNPTDPSSRVFGPEAIISESAFTLTWPVLPGRTYRLEASSDLIAWEEITSTTPGNYAEQRSIPSAAPERFYRLSVGLTATISNANGLTDWENALYQKFFDHPLLPATDSDGDGLSDITEFHLGRDPKKKDYPAVGLVVFTPLEK